MNNATGECRLPEFIVIGAVKAATTWIQEQLCRNPQVFMPGPEPHFFSREFDRGTTHYARFFDEAPTAACIGEKSADYLAHPLAPARIAKMLPEVRLLAQLRDPVRRAYSDYKMLYRRGTVSGPPEDYLLSPDNPQPRFLRDGLYGQHLERWYDHFPADHLLVFRYRDVREDGESVVRAASHHIGVEPVFDSQFAEQRRNDSRAKLLPLGLRKAMAPFKATVRPLRGNPIFETTRSLLARDVAYPPLGSDTERRLRDFYLPDIERLEKLLDWDLSDWKPAGRDRADVSPEQGSGFAQRASSSLGSFANSP